MMMVMGSLVLQGLSPCNIGIGIGNGPSHHDGACWMLDGSASLHVVLAKSDCQ